MERRRATLVGHPRPPQFFFLLLASPWYDISQPLVLLVTMRPKRPRVVEAPSGGVSRRSSGRAASPEGVALGDSDSEPAAGGRAGADEEEEEEVEETAGEKRLRLAKAYLSTLRAELAQDKASKRSALSDEDEEGEEEEGAEGDGALGQRLAADARYARGEAQRSLALRVRLPSAAAPRHGTLWKGHSRPVTALALSSDDGFCVSAAKDGTLLRQAFANTTKAGALTVIFEPTTNCTFFLCQYRYKFHLKPKGGE